MKIFQKIAIVAALTAGWGIASEAQVQFKIERMHDSEYFMISAIPEVTYAAPFNMVSTAQVTIKVPTGKFKMPEIMNLQTAGQWRVNGRCNAPQEAPEFDYLYFGLQNLGTAAFKFEKDKPTPLFLLKATEKCDVKIQLVDNHTDAFFGKNSMRANIGNQITILGAEGDAWTGNRDGGICECHQEETPEVAAGEILIFPNPVSGSEVKFAFNKTEKDNTSCDLFIYDMSGRRIFMQKLAPKDGYNEFTLDVSKYPIGVYQMEISGLKLRPMYQQIIKSE